MDSSQAPSVSEMRTVLCESCKKPLGVTVARVNADGCRLWHPECLRCCNCRKELESGWFHEKKKSLFCANCFNDMFRKRCADCCKPMKNDGNQIRAMDVQFHQRCFRCQLCKNVLTRHYSILNKRPMCFECLLKEPVPETVEKVFRHKFASHDSSVTTARHLQEEDIFNRYD